jgi:hypothetical protein
MNIPCKNLHLLLSSLEENWCIDLLDVSRPGPDLSIYEELGAIDVGPVDVCGIFWANLANFPESVRRQVRNVPREPFRKQIGTRAAMP